MTRPPPAPDAGRPPLWRDLLLGLAVFGLYLLVAGWDTAARRALADRNARGIWAAESLLRIDVEPALNRLLLPHPTLRVLANYEYAITYVLAAFAMLGWLYARRPDQYRWARDSFAMLNLVGIACFVLYPVTPPRLLPDLGFVDTVRLGHTWGSWGSPLVSHANQLAAMPSLHIAWAVWVSVALARVAGGCWVQAGSALHVLVTLLVIVVTANHFLLDAAGGVLAVVICLPLTRLLRPPPGTRVPPADAFFLYVESPAAPQHVGGVAVLDTSGHPFDRDRLVAVLRDHLDELPMFQRRLAPPSRWRRPRWVPAGELDWEWHVPQRDLTGPDGRPGGTAALDALVAELAATPLPRDRPLWRFVAVDGLAPDRAAVVLLVHHVIADGFGTVAQALRLMEPRIAVAGPDAAGPASPGPLRRAAGVAVGLAQLATDGLPERRLPGGTGGRDFGAVALPLEPVREAARRYRTRVSDLLLSAVAGGLRRVLADPPRGALRVAVPLMVRHPGATAEGNLTAGVITDVPLGPMPELERLAATARGSRRLYSGTRALASHAVMRVAGVALPVPVHAWFARTVYGGRFFQGIVSNMPGPRARLSMAGAPLLVAYPILPLAPRAPLAVGALGWDGSLALGVAVDPALVPDAGALARAVRDVLAELAAQPSAQAAPPGAAPSGAPAGTPAGLGQRPPLGGVGGPV